MPSRSELAPSDAQWIGDLVKDAADQLFRMRDAGLAGKVHLDMGDLRLVMYGIASAVHNRRAASGWVSAPLEPTPDMAFSGGGVSLDGLRLKKKSETELTGEVCVGMDNATTIYKAMLSALPSPPGKR